MAWASTSTEVTGTEPEGIVVDIDVTTDLAGAGCARINATRFRCTWLAGSSEPEGWLSATFEMTDLAGNVGSDTAPLGAALDLGSLLEFDCNAVPPTECFGAVSVTPSPATRGMTVEIGFRASLPVDGNPVVTVADFPAQWESGPSAAGDYVYSYVVVGVELGDVTAPGVLRTVRVPLTAGQLDRLLVLGEMGVLIAPIGSTTTTGATSLAIDPIYLDVEKD